MKSNYKTIPTIIHKFQEAHIEGYEWDRRKKISHPGDVCSMFQKYLAYETVEHFLVVWLNSANRVMGFEETCKGILNATVIHPREVFRGAIVAGAANVILIHNHPSGSEQPSNEDISVTKKLKDAGEIIDIRIFDHIIITKDNYYSFTEHHTL